VTQMAGLAIIHTSDFHGHLTDAGSLQLAELRATEGALLFDSGDALFLPQWLPYTFCDPVIRRMNAAGYDAGACGNHEYFLRSRQMARRTRDLRCPVVCANLLWPRGTDGRLRRWETVRTPSGENVGVFGLIPPMIPPGSGGERFSGMRFIPWEQAAQEAIAALRPEVTWLVALLHIGRAGDERIARAFPEIDLILAGHSHVVTPEPERIGGVSIVRSGCHAKTASVVRSESDAPPSAFTQRLVELR